METLVLTLTEGLDTRLSGTLGPLFLSAPGRHDQAHLPALL